MSERLRHAAPDVPGVRAKALAAASQILAAQGVERLNLKAIAESAGVGISSIYHWFANKEELLLNLALMGFQDLRVDLIQVRGRPEYASPLAAGARAFLGFAETRPALFSVMFSERLLNRHPDLRAAEQEALAAFETTVGADARFPEAHQADIGTVLWTLARGMASIISSYPGGEVPPELRAKFRGGLRYLLGLRGEG
ncbi:MAG TPA: TetR/AcrR family transcriptional regulator [Polyangia bacterium]|jgi:AcrR family transcriptional regulator